MKGSDYESSSDEDESPRNEYTLEDDDMPLETAKSGQEIKGEHTDSHQTQEEEAGNRGTVGSLVSHKRLKGSSLLWIGSYKRRGRCSWLSRQIW